jgi:hypothetical protein
MVPANTPTCKTPVPQTTCKSCSPGYFSRANGGTACEPAPAGSFVGEAGAAQPVPCPANTFSSGNASSSCKVRGRRLGIDWLDGGHGQSRAIEP